MERIFKGMIGNIQMEFLATTFRTMPTIIAQQKELEEKFIAETSE